MMVQETFLLLMLLLRYLTSMVSRNILIIQINRDKSTLFLVKKI